jgi:hypothetical protein
LKYHRIKSRLWGNPALHECAFLNPLGSTPCATTHGG